MDNAECIKIKGINVCNPVAVEKDYLLYTVDYAAKYGFNHIQVNGPIHDMVIGNIDGMTPYRKYSQFDRDKDNAYIQQAMDAINAACEKAAVNGIKIYVWHHELDLPTTFSEVYPQICNSDGDIEVSHPLVRDFLENKIMDFFHYYPEVSGIILTLHETKVPLLKLKNQKLEKVERVKYITEVLYKVCTALGKELVVRPFASLQEDYDMLMDAYEQISNELPVMDKWTQFDWSLTMPHNSFFNKIQNNPLLVEADVFGEYFGKGRLPLMLKKHIDQKFDYCSGFSPLGYVARIDRAGRHPFGDVNEVNVIMTIAHLNGNDAEHAAVEFFKEKYPVAYHQIMELMLETENILEKIFYVHGYDFTQLSLFPNINHSINNMYFEMMRKDCNIQSDDWYIPANWKPGSHEEILAEKREAMEAAGILFEKLTNLKDCIEPIEYEKLLIKFGNFKYVAEVWYAFTKCIISYVNYFENPVLETEAAFSACIEDILKIRKRAVEEFGDQFYCIGVDKEGNKVDFIVNFTEEITEYFSVEKKITEEIRDDQNVVDFIVCGGAMEGHQLRKEVNFSDSLIKDGAVCRIAGNKRGMAWSSINAHGWFGYRLKVEQWSRNQIKIRAGSTAEWINMKVSIGEETYIVEEKLSGTKEFVFQYDAREDEVTVRIDKNGRDTPCIYTIIAVKAE